jgi:hypothetical protein
LPAVIAIITFKQGLAIFTFNTFPGHGFYCIRLLFSNLLLYAGKLFVSFEAMHSLY